MNKQAKKLRRIARALGKKMNLVAKDYVVRNGVKAILVPNLKDPEGPAMKTVHWPVTQVRLIPTSQRYIYQKMKTDFKNMSHLDKSRELVKMRAAAANG